MDNQEYSREVEKRVSIPNGPAHERERLLLGALGIAGESGEVVDVIKKVIFHGHHLDVLKLELELGDVLWYLVELLNTVGSNLETIMKRNVEKLQARYGDRFDSERSIYRDPNRP